MMVLAYEHVKTVVATVTITTFGYVAVFKAA